MFSIQHIEEKYCSIPLNEDVIFDMETMEVSVTLCAAVYESAADTLDGAVGGA
jgi:hypothetical protein